MKGIVDKVTRVATDEGFHTRPRGWYIPIIVAVADQSIVCADLAYCTTVYATAGGEIGPTVFSPEG